MYNLSTLQFVFSKLNFKKKNLIESYFLAQLELGYNVDI